MTYTQLSEGAHHSCSGPAHVVKPKGRLHNERRTNLPSQSVCNPVWDNNRLKASAVLLWCSNAPEHAQTNRVTRARRDTVICLHAVLYISPESLKHRP